MAGQGRPAPIHCITNPVTMESVANVLLAAGGSAIMAQDPAEAEEIAALSRGVLLNTGVPDAGKFRACMLAGRRACGLGLPVVLDPVGAGASRFRREGLKNLLREVRMSVIRCNQEEAQTLLAFPDPESGSDAGEEMRAGLWKSGELRSGGVESAVSVEAGRQADMAKELAGKYGCAVLVTGDVDAVSDGGRTELIGGGDGRLSRITGGGCMLSALCALLCAEQKDCYEAVRSAAALWRESARAAGIRADREQGGIGVFRMYLFDEVERRRSL
ncbi:MAG: hydroxyethylthiazole kinase [Eubacteriales bacterium]|nr:hydroxyethylthiazole kinase [Eubacteriales bacterium]